MGFLKKITKKVESGTRSVVNNATNVTAKVIAKPIEVIAPAVGEASQLVRSNADTLGVVGSVVGTAAGAAIGNPATLANVGNLGDVLQNFANNDKTVKAGLFDTSTLKSFLSDIKETIAKQPVQSNMNPPTVLYSGERNDSGKSSNLPWIIGGVAVVGVLGLVTFLALRK